MKKLSVVVEKWPIAGVFRISRGSRTEATVVVARIEGDGVVGQGESVPYQRYGETVEGVVEAIEELGEAVAEGLTRVELLDRLPPGAARNALDGALWDFEAKKSGKSAAEIAGMSEPEPVVTAVTISIDTPEKMAEAAAKLRGAPLIKVKLGGEEDVERMIAVRGAAPKARLIVDANEGWTPELCRRFLPEMAKLGVELIEQPLPAGEDEMLGSIDRVVPICADESVHVASDLSRLRKLYDYINIKLDKTGGLTEALRLVDAAKEADFGIMVGCMLGTSLAMAPAVLLTPSAEFVDLDGPLLLAKDRSPAIDFTDNKIHLAPRELWG